MTQGYGSDHGPQGQWGQGGQSPPPAPPQWGQGPQQAPAPQPQWGPAPTGPGGYQGAAGGTGARFGPGDGINWRRVKLLGLLMLIGAGVLLLLRLGINLSMFLAAEDIAATNAGGDIGAVGIGSSLALLLLYPANWFLGLVLFVLGIIAAVSGRGRARLGGIIVAVAVPLSVVLYWILNFLVGVILVMTGVADPVTGALPSTGYRISAGTDSLHSIAITALIALGAYFVHSTASKKLSA